MEFTKEGYTKLKNKLATAKKHSHHPAQQLEEISKTYWDFAFHNPEFYQLMFSLGMPACETVNSIPEVKAFTTVMLDSISTAISASSDPEADVFLKFHSYWSIIHGSVFMQMMNKEATIAVNNYDKLQDATSGFIKTLSA
ncbi:MAG: TetR-like C-terminal domain-containing protein [Sphingobacteriaceae bacterium]